MCMILSKLRSKGISPHTLLQVEKEWKNPLEEVEILKQLLADTLSFKRFVSGQK